MVDLLRYASIVALMTGDIHGIPAFDFDARRCTPAPGRRTHAITLTGRSWRESDCSGRSVICFALCTLKIAKVVP